MVFISLLKSGNTLLLVTDVQKELRSQMNKRKKYNLGKVTNPQIKNCIDDWVHSLAHRNMLKRIYMYGLTNQEVAEEFGYCENTIKNIVKDYYPVLKEHIKDY